MKPTNWLACTIMLGGVFVLASFQATAEPAPAPPIDAGGYETPWGKGQFRIVGTHGVLALADGSVMWGPLDNNGRGWSGRWVRAPGAARTDAAHRPCRTQRWNVPSSFTVPSSGYWGEFRAHSLRVNGPRAISLSWASCFDRVSSASKQMNIVQSAPPQYSYSSTPAILPPIAGRYDGSCHSISGSAIAHISPCLLAPVRTFRLTLLRDVQKPVGRILFRPLVDDRARVAEALARNTALPLHPTDSREVYQIVRGDKLHMRGSSADIMPPLTICEHDFWTVSVLDGTGRRHDGNGVLTMTCGPGRYTQAVGSEGGERRLEELPVRKK